MDAQTYQDAVKVCGTLAQKTGDSGLNALSGWFRSAMEQEHKPTMALVSFNMNHAERFDIVNRCAGIHIPAEFASLAKGEPACFLLDYSKKPTLLSDPSSKEMLVLGLPHESLKTRRIAICDEIKVKEKWLVLSGEIDVACLLVNATMAMNQVERTWLKECGKPLYWGVDPAVAVVGTQLLNTEEDVQAVKDAVADGLRRLQMDSRIFDTPQEAIAWMEQLLSGGNVRESRDRRVMKNALTAARERAMTFMDAAAVDGGSIEAAVSQLESQRASLTMAAQLLSESILQNELNRLKTMAVQSIRDFGGNMAKDIKSHVENFPIDQLGSVDEYVNKSATEAWDSFIQTMTVTTDNELQKLSARLAEQMERDAGDMIAQLDESAQRTLYSALAFAPASSVASASGPIPVRAPAEYAGVNVDEVTGQLRRETRNMMLLSIPILLVNPLLAIGNIFVSKAIGKFRTDSELKSARADMAAQIDMMCSANAETVVRFTEEGFDRQLAQCSQNIKAAYAGLIARLEDNLARMKAEQSRKAADWDVLDDLIRRALPELLTRADG